MNIFYFIPSLHLNVTLNVNISDWPKIKMHATTQVIGKKNKNNVLLRFFVHLHLRSGRNLIGAPVFLNLSNKSLK